MKKRWSSAADSQIYLPNLLLISGSGRKVGKTWLACNLIRKWKNHVPVVAIKISRHRHDPAYRMKQLVSGEGFVIWEEFAGSWKDTGKFFDAGAYPVLFVEADTKYLFDAFRHAIDFTGKDRMIICESGGLINFVKPGFMIFIQSAEFNPDGEKSRIKALADLVVTSGELESVADRIQICDGEWRLTK